MTAARCAIAVGSSVFSIFIVTSPFKKPVRVILLDIEGTTTPIDFVYKILFPYARANVKSYLENHQWSAGVQPDISGLLEENPEDVTRGLDPPRIEGPPEQVSIDRVVAYVHWLMDRDRKSTPLKSLQGKIWEEGYGKGELRGQIFEDVARAFDRWRGQNREICIYSSGSVLAQKLLFANTENGDLTAFIRCYFDTTIGAKTEANGYRRIAGSLERQPAEIVFVSDVTAELDAAASAGFETLLCARPGNPFQGSSTMHAVVNSFDDILPN